MKQWFYKFTPIILVALTSLFFFIGLYLNSRIRVSGRIIIATLWLIIAGASFALSRLIQKLHYSSYRDYLTRLYNRRYLYEKLAMELRKVRQKGSPLSFIILDLDDFKRVNDTFGHGMGDEVLKSLATLLEVNSRAMDTIARWGGEEFAIILPETDSEGTESYAERLRTLIDSFLFCSGHLTISLGVATTYLDVYLDQFVKLADDALYRAKQRKNTVVVAVCQPDVEVVGIR